MKICFLSVLIGFVLARCSFRSTEYKGGFLEYIFSDLFLNHVLSMGTQWGFVSILSAVILFRVHLYVVVLLFVFTWLDGTRQQAIQLSKQSVIVLGYNTKPTTNITRSHKWAFYSSVYLLICGILVTLLGVLIPTVIVFMKFIVPIFLLIMILRMITFFKR